MLTTASRDLGSDTITTGNASNQLEWKSTGELPDVLPFISRKPSLNSADFENTHEGNSTSTAPPQTVVSQYVSPHRRALLPSRRIRPLQQWEGLVTDVGTDSFWAELTDLTDSTKANEVAEILLAEISPEDRPLLVPGCVFYWSIGYEISRGGQIENRSVIRVRRNPLWSKLQLERMKKAGKDLFTELQHQK